MYSDRIQLVHQQHEEQLSKEREKAQQRFQEMKEKLTSELTSVQSQLTLLQNKLEKCKKEKEKRDDQGEKQQPQVVIDKKEDELSKKKKKGRAPSRRSDGFLRDIHVTATPPIKRVTRQKSASQEMLDSLGLDPVTGRSESSGKGMHTPDSCRTSGKMAANGNTETKLSITKLVAESIRNPASVAAIRRELKADGLTPKIQRKFQHNLPSMPTSNDA